MGNVLVYGATADVVYIVGIYILVRVVWGWGRYYRMVEVGHLQVTRTLCHQSPVRFLDILWSTKMSFELSICIRFWWIQKEGLLVQIFGQKTLDRAPYTIEFSVAVDEIQRSKS